jgi:DNA polymerase-4
MRLRNHGLVAGSLRVKVKFVNRTDWEKEIPCGPTCDTLQLIRALGLAWQDYPAGKCAPIVVGISFDKLSTPTEQPLSLFDYATPKHDKLNAVMDAMNLRYGKNALYFGGAHQALSSAPMRIAFTHIPDTTVEGD